MFYRKHPRVLTPVGTVNMTKQSHKNECDINLILKQYQKTGQITHISNQQPLYTDLPEYQDFQESLNVIKQSEYAFSQLPARVRDRFNNSPLAFLQALGDPSQRDFLTEMGVLKAPPAPSGAEPAAKGSEPPPA